MLALVCTASLAFCRAVGPEPFWWATVVHYLPGALWVIPTTALLLGNLLWRRGAVPPSWLRWVRWLPVACLLYLLGPWMGLVLPHAQKAPGASTGEAGGRFRVMAYNVKRDADHPGVILEIMRQKPDLLVATEVQPDATLGETVVGWEHAEAGSTRLYSRFPILSVEKRKLVGNQWRSYLRVRLQIHQRSVVVYAIHLDTPREAFEALIKGRWHGLESAERLTRTRVGQAEEIARVAALETDPVVVAGDFNAPPASRVMRGFQGRGFRDAFDEAGVGYGFTYGHSLRWGYSYVRIDHLLCDEDLRPLRCWVGGADGSDHRPVIADFQLR